MGFIFFDESKHAKRNFHVGSFVYCDSDPSKFVDDTLSYYGYDPTSYEFKSSARMDAGHLHCVRSELSDFVFKNCRIALCICGQETNLGEASLNLLEKMLLHPTLIDKTHNVFFDEGLFKNKTAARRSLKRHTNLSNHDFYVEQNSMAIKGIQIADHVAHSCAIMLADETGDIQKATEFGFEAGYEPPIMINIGYEIWARIRYSFLVGDETEEESMSYDLNEFGLYLSSDLTPAIRHAALSRFGSIYMGCIH